MLQLFRVFLFFFFDHVVKWWNINGGIYELSVIVNKLSLTFFLSVQKNLKYQAKIWEQR